jgi:hypothetical protein
MASDRAAAHADSVTNLPEIPESSQAAKVAARDTFINGKLFHIDNDGTGRPCTSDHWHRDGAARTMTAAKVAAIMAANDITLPQVAAWLNTYGFDVINRAEFREWTWTPAPAGTYPIAYYVANFRVATGSNSLRVYLPQTAGPYWIRVKAYDGQGNSGPWSMTSTSAAGDLLPGVAE